MHAPRASASAPWPLLLLILLISSIIAPLTIAAEADDAIQRPDPERWRSTMDRFARSDANALPPRDAVLFVGSSSIGMWNLNKWFPDRTTIKRGFGGSIIHDSVVHFDQVIRPYHPKVLVFYAGENDIMVPLTPEQAADDFRTLMGKIREVYPDLPVLFLAAKLSGSRWSQAEAFRRFNALVEAHAATDGRLWFVDVSEATLGPDGEPDDALFVNDRLHLNDAGYQAWMDILTPYLIQAENQEMLGTPIGRLATPEGVEAWLFLDDQGRHRVSAWSWDGTQAPSIAADLTSQPTFLELEQVPPAWLAQANTRLLSPDVVAIWSGDQAAELIVELPADAAVDLFFDGLPHDLEAQPQPAANGRVSVRLIAGDGLPQGVHAAHLVAWGDGWEKVWPLRIQVKPAVSAWAAPYRPGEPTPVVIRGQAPQPVAITVGVSQGQGSRLEIAPGREERATIQADESAQGPLAVTLTQANGHTIELEALPGSRPLPRATGITLDGRLDDWPAAAAYPPAALQGAVPDEAALHMAWDDNGLLLGVRMPFDGQPPARDEQFWTGTTVELLLNTDPENRDPRAASVHQYWVAPRRAEGDDTWRAVPGEWKRSDAIEATLFDDSRIDTAMSFEDGMLTMEARIGVEALGARPAAGVVWRGMVSAQTGSNTSAARIPAFGWPTSKRHPAWNQVAAWGAWRLEE